MFFVAYAEIGDHRSELRAGDLEPVLDGFRCGFVLPASIFFSHSRHKYRDNPDRLKLQFSPVFILR